MSEPAPILEVRGPAVSYADLRRLAEGCRGAAGRLRALAATDGRMLVDPALLLSAPVSPVTFAEAGARLVAAATGPDGLVPAGCGCDLDAELLEQVGHHLAEADAAADHAMAALHYLIGRAVGEGLAATAPGWIPLLGLAAAVGAVTGAGPVMEGLLTDHPALVQQLAASGGGLVDGLGPLVAAYTPDTGAAAGVLGDLYPGGPVTATALPGVAVPASGTAPAGVAGLLDHLAQLSALSGPEHPELNGTVEVQTLTASDGSVHHVVYLPGTDQMTTLPWTQGEDVRDMGTNLQLVHGTDNGYLEGLVDVLDQAGIAPGEPVLLAGHSQGGMLAAQLAAHATDLAASHGVDVAGAVTFGSPIALTGGYPPGVPVLSLENHGDLVPQLDGADNPAGADQVTVVFDGGGVGAAGHHSFPSYAAGALAVDASEDPVVAGAVQQVSDLLGGPGATVTGSQVFQIVRQP